jgi:hypothetical protein
MTRYAQHQHIECSNCAMPGARFATAGGCCRPCPLELNAMATLAAQASQELVSKIARAFQRRRGGQARQTGLWPSLADPCLDLDHTAQPDLNSKWGSSQIEESSRWIQGLYHEGHVRISQKRTSHGTTSLGSPCTPTGKKSRRRK